MMFPLHLALLFYSAPSAASASAVETKVLVCYFGIRVALFGLLLYLALSVAVVGEVREVGK